MSINPLKQYFRQAILYVKLPTQGRWYTSDDVTFSSEGEVGVYALTALDDILLNTPDAMLNGQALEKVISNCCPDVKNVKRLMLPDLEAIFVGIKSATNGGKADYDRKCPQCNHENSFELNCQHLLDSTMFINEDDLSINFGNDLIVHVKPYDFEMRQLFTKREFEEERSLRMFDEQNKDVDELTKATLLGQSVDRLSQMTFSLVSRSIEKIEMVKEKIIVDNRDHINEWLVGISKAQADMVIESVNRINGIGVPKTIPVLCSNCNHQWGDTLTFDPSSFFGKRS
jgi:hypothetical protein